MASWASCEYVFVVRPVCPACGSPSYRKVRTESYADGASLKKVFCTDCGERYKIVTELPESGNHSPTERYDAGEPINNLRDKP